MNNIWALLLFLIISNPLSSQNGFSSFAGARGIGIGNANITYHDIHSGFNNQAGLAFLENISAIAILENRFFLEELNLVAVGLAIPTESGTWGMQWQYFGFAEFNEQKVGLNYSRLLFKKVAIGAQFNFLATNLKEYGKITTLTFELGLQYALNDKIRAGFHLLNPTRTRLGASPLPSVLQIGFTYQIGQNLELSSSIEKDTFLPLNFRLGLEYQFQEKVYFRTGINSNPQRLSFGIGYTLKIVDLNFAAWIHEALGVSPSFGIVYKGKKESKN